MVKDFSRQNLYVLIGVLVVVAIGLSLWWYGWNRPAGQQREETVITSPLLAPEVEDQTDVQREALEERVAEILEQNDVSRRSGIDDVFLLADLHANEGDNQEAIRLYEEGLRVDSWRLAYQLKLARLLAMHGDKDQAAEKATVVYEYAEDEGLIDDAVALLSDLEISLPEHRVTGRQEFETNIEIVMVPIGPVNTRLMEEAIAELQDKLGIKYSIMDDVVDLGELDRHHADQYLTRVVDYLRISIPPEEIEALLAKVGLTEVDLETSTGRVQFIEAIAGETEGPGAVEAFRERLKELEGKGQFDASRLLDELKQYYPIDEGSRVRGYLGVTEADIFSDDNNYLFGSARKGHAVMSYHRFRARFGGEIPNRPRLRQRFVKQTISSSFFSLGIPRCTSPTCARAYPHSLIEHDQKGLELCAWCRKQLKGLVKKAEQ